MAASFFIPVQIHSGRDLHSFHFFVLRHHFIEFFIGEINVFIAGLSVNLEKDWQKLDIPALGFLYRDIAARIGDDADFVHIESFPFCLACGKPTAQCLFFPAILRQFPFPL